MTKDDGDDNVAQETNQEKALGNELTNDSQNNGVIASSFFYNGSDCEISKIPNKIKQSKTSSKAENNFSQNNKESPYELIHRGSLSVSRNERVSISRIHRRRPKGKDVKSMYVVGDSMVAFKDGMPGSFSPLTVHSTRRNVKSVPVFPQEITLEPERPPRKNRLKVLSSQQARICKYQTG